MDYFSILNMPVQILLDEKLLRQQYLRLSREVHPDFHTLSDAASREQSLVSATEITNAYTCLKDFDARLQYILKETGMLQADEKSTLPPDFLMEMMDFNDAIMAADTDEDKSNLRASLKDMETGILEAATPALSMFDDGSRTAEVMQSIKDFYMKKRYLWRLHRQLDAGA
jgi:molecular chaperone HscB